MRVDRKLGADWPSGFGPAPEVRKERTIIMKTAVAAVTAVIFMASSAQAATTDEGLFEVKDVERDTVPAGTPAAFEAAFAQNTHGGPGRWYEVVRVIDGDSVTFVPLTLVPLPDGMTALVSTGASDCSAQACTGRNSVHYLERHAGSYKVAGAWLNVGARGTMGNPAQRWGWTDAIGAGPVLYTEGGGVWQGYACSFATLTHLTPGGPVEIATFPVHYSNSGASADGQKLVKVDGRIISAQKDKSFTVHYTGSKAFSERYVVGSDGRYAVEGVTHFPKC